MPEKEINNSKALESLSKIITIIPEQNTELLADLESIDKNAKDVRISIMAVLQEHLFIPGKNWEFEVISIASGIPLRTIKNMFTLAKIKSAISRIV